LLIPAAALIIGIYTDWGNLKIVSCVAWLNGTGPGSSTVVRGMGALGASISWLRARGWWNARGGLPFRMVHSAQLGDAEKIR
jgi:hypothetical protein